MIKKPKERMLEAVSVSVKSLIVCKFTKCKKNLKDCQFCKKNC